MYIFVQVEFHSCTTKDMMVSSIALSGDPVWISKDCVHASDAGKLSDLQSGQQTELRILEDVAIEKGLI